MSLLKAENLKKSYGRQLVVKGVDLDVRSGEIVGLLGRNGAGKTTIFQTVVGLLRPDEGRVSLDGRDITSTPTHERARLGLTYLPQEHSVFLKATVEGNLKLGLELQPLSREERKEVSARLLQELGLSELSQQPAHSLSGGERRRLEICRALIIEPKFLLLDEPFTGIDPLTIAEIQGILRMLKEKGIGVLLSDHNVRETFEIADRVTIIDGGEILVSDTPVRAAVNAKAKERFLGQDFKLGGEVSDLRTRERPRGRPESLPGRTEKGKNKRREESRRTP